MSEAQVSVAMDGSDVPIFTERTVLDRELQELWLAVSARPWRSLVLVPAGPAGSAAPLARSLAAAGNQLGELPVGAFVNGGLEPGVALALVDGGDPSSRVVVAIPPVVIQPRGVVLARRADAVVAWVERGRTRLDDVRRTMELIRPERFIGCVLVG
jgi:hypothetical protein